MLVLVSFISGVYPALILTGFNPIYSLKNAVVLPGRSSTLLRKGLVVFQFTISVVLIICTIVIARQMNYFQKKELGFNKEAVVEVGLPTPDSVRMEKFRTLLQSTTGVQNFSFCLGAPISEMDMNTSLQDAEKQQGTDYNINLILCDSAYLNTYGLKLIAGRWFLSSEEKNLGSSIVVNETLIKTLGYKNPAEAIGKKITIGVNHYSPTVIGVTKDFHTSSLHQSIIPVGLMPFPYFYYAAAIRISGNTRTILNQIESAWKAVYPESVYSMHFIDETLAQRYEQETRDYNLFKAFSGISIFICCIGLWGLIAFVVVRKTKEIGIRKVLGATVRGIVLLLSKDFLKLVFIALLIASPIAWYFMHQWLQNFAYRISISWWVFAAAGFIALTIALATVSFQAVKAALANPVKNLRTE
ncbi:MAG: ABC transporter permease, partial [Flavisolibacter sp.]|nr:ABC transporter permease [Flavisolibacter sp.]